MNLLSTLRTFFLSYAGRYLMILLLLAGCGNTDNPDNASVSQSKKKPLDLVEEFSKQSDFSLAHVQKILGPMKFKKSVSSTKFFDIHKATKLDSTWIRSVELRYPKKGHHSNFAMLTLEIKKETELSKEKIRSRYGKPDKITPPSPHHGAHSKSYYFNYTKPWGTVTFGFFNSDDKISDIIINTKK